eukprot:gene876-956_t
MIGVDGKKQKQKKKKKIETEAGPLPAAPVVVKKEKEEVINDNLFHSNQSLYELFHHHFQEKCVKKYAFIQRYIKHLEDPPPSASYLIFTFHRPSLRNGGLGDRMGGLITAVAAAIKSNRTLLIEASNGLFDYFKPYHPLDKGKTDEEAYYTWSNQLIWSHFPYPSLDSWSSHVDDVNDHHDEDDNSIKVQIPSLDLTDCVSNTEAGFTLDQTKRCAMMNGLPADIPVVRFTSNRAYLCLWTNRKVKQGRSANQKFYPAYYETLQELGLTSKSNLFEAAGCMLRLVLWPREKLWRSIDEAYATLSHGKMKAKMKKGDKKKKKSSHKAGLQDPVDLPSLKNSYEHIVRSSFIHHIPAVYQVGLHFRCGDIHSYRYGYLHTQGYDKKTCIFDVGKDESVMDFGSIGKSHYMNAGHPYSIGQCAKHMLNELVNRSDDMSVQSLEREEVEINSDSSSTTLNTTTPSAQAVRYPIALYITSDNLIASEQMWNISEHAWSVVSPQGCHIEFDGSKECFQVTSVYWFMLALSQKIISQTFNTPINAPTSSFSRYAAIYGLWSEWPLHSGRYCEDKETSMTALSRVDQGNWRCNL